MSLRQADEVSTGLAAGIHGRSLGFQAVALAIGTAVAQGMTAAMYVIAARHSDPGVFGALVAAIAVGSAGVGVVDFGGNVYWVRELAGRRLWASELGTRVLVKVACAVLLALVWLVGCRYVLGAWLPAIAAPILVTTLISQMASVFLRAAARSDLAALALILDRLCAFVLMVLLFFWAGVSPVVALWVSLSTGALFGAGACWVLSPKVFRPTVRWNQDRNPWRGAGAFGVSALANSGQTLDVAVLAATGGGAAAGLYGAVSRWTQPMGLVVNAFSLASAPMVASARSWEEAWRRMRGSLWLPALAVAGCVVAALASPWLVPLLLGRDYDGSAAVLAILAIGTIPAILNQPVSVFLQSRGHQRPVSVIFVVTVVLQLGLIAVLAPHLAARSGALAFLIGQVSQLAALAVLLIRLAPRSRRG